jgi:hypothetical protein
MRIILAASAICVLAADAPVIAAATDTELILLS